MPAPARDRRLARAAPPRHRPRREDRDCRTCRTPPGERGLHATAARCGRSKAVPAKGSECVASSKRCSTLFHSTIHARDDHGDCDEPRGQARRTEAVTLSSPPPARGKGGAVPMIQRVAAAEGSSCGECAGADRGCRRRQPRARAAASSPDRCRVSASRRSPRRRRGSATPPPSPTAHRDRARR